MIPGRGRRLLAGATLGLLSGLLVRELGLAAVVSYHGGRFWLVLAFTVAGALLGLTPLRRGLAPLAAALAALYLVVAATPLSRALADGLVRRDAPAAADAVFVLASDLQEDGDLGATALDRLSAALALLRGGHATRLVVADIAGRPSHGAAVRRTLDALGVQTDLLVIGPVDSTRDEAVAAAELFRQRGWRRLLLVTSPLHSRRAAATFARQGLEVLSVPSRETQFDVDTLTQPDDRVRAFGPILHERVGLVVYGWRGWLVSH